ncbi:MAG TPA: mechanosensitive ion channel domain-containing protein [Fluviicola sp.]|nr:mechanosensitive ion channel domain-containing protein [Fluviicola sp.]
MMTKTLFWLGPYKVCFWNILIIALVIFLAIVARKVIHRLLKRYLTGANIRIEGRRITWLRLLSQTVYVLAGYFAILSFKINNHNVSFQKFLDYKFIHYKNFSINFENIIAVVLIFFGAKVTINLINLYLQRRFRKDEHFDRGTEYVYMQVTKYVIYTIAFIFCLGALNVQPSIFLGGSAALLVGLGLGLQDVFKDMFSGFVLLFEGTIRVGDVIEFNDGKSSENIVAKILKINVRTTQIETRDGNILIVPNTKLTQEYVENWSHGSNLSRFRINLVVPYNVNTQMVSDLLVQAAMSHPKVKKSEPIQVRMTDFGDHGLCMELIFWADQSWDINQYKSEIRFEIDRLFRHYKIDFPYPKRDIHVFQGTKKDV